MSAMSEEPLACQQNGTIKINTGSINFKFGNYEFTIIKFVMKELS